jgi:hypothetical protein
MKAASMPIIETPAAGLHGSWQDVIRNASGAVIDKTRIRSNAIVVDCRRILASFMAGAPTLGIQGMLFGTGLSAWDVDGPPAASPAQTALTDPNPYLVPAASLQIDFLDDIGTVVPGPTNRLQIVATLGPGQPSWPDANHVAGSLREFALVGELNGSPALINYVTHPVINKDPANSLERTLWLVF